MENIEDLYVASPMQRGLVFHRLYAPESSAYFVQTIYDLQGDLNLDAFQLVWQHILDRYGILRTSFVWEELDEVLQVVHRHLTLPWQNYDWRALPETEQQARLREFIEDDRLLKIDLSEPPLLRMTLIRLADRQWKFIWSHHHSLLDGWSAFLILKDAFRIYELVSTDQKVKLTPARSYREFIAWLDQQDIGAAERFWRKRLKGLTDSTPLTGERHFESQPEQRSEVTEQQSHREDAHLPAEMTEKLKLLARKHQLTLNTIMQGAWALLLSRYSGETDVLFGTVVSGRPPELSGVEEMVGPFINLLPLRIKAEGKLPLLAWLKQLQAEQVEMRDYEYSPLVDVQGWSDIPRGLPLFESIMSFHNYPIDASFQKSDVGLRVTKVSSIEKTNYPLSLNVMPDTELHLQLGYDPAYRNREQARRMLSHLVRILEEIAAHPEKRLRELTLLTEAEESQILRQWNDTRTVYSELQSVSQLFEAQAERGPRAVAVATAEVTMSYEELNEKANQVAHYLQKLNVGPEIVVGVLMERSVEMLIALLGILKAGGAYLPIDPSYPRQRQVWMLNDSGAQVLMMKDWPAEGFPDYRGHLISLDILGASLESESTQNPASKSQIGNLAYVIYTSGSTGEPKGVAITMGALLNLIFWHQRFYEVTPADRATQVAGVGFDASVWELWPYLTAGASIHIPDDETRSAPTLLRDWIVGQDITISFLPTPLAEQLLPLKWPEDLALRALLTGGDRLHQHPAGSLPFKLFNNYGPTENTVVATSGLIRPAKTDDRAPSIGRPIANTDIYLLDRDLQPVPVGVAGELHIGGKSLARGYLGGPESTAQKFIPHPFTAEAGARLYRTGDVGRYLVNGEIEFIGRRDEQVKLRGFRIELGEIEATLRRHPQVGDAAVTFHEHLAEHKQLVAYVVAPKRPAPSGNELRDYLKERLPEYMVPSAYVLLDALPLTANGKIDRRALPAPDSRALRSDSSYVAPSTPAEHVLVEIWQQVLGVERVSIHDNFFDLGGDSILSIQIVARANRAGLRFSPKQLFDHPTVVVLAATADVVTEGSSTEDDVVTGEVELTPIHRMFLNKWKIVDRNHYNQAVMLDVRAGTEVDHLKRVLQHLIDYHDGLRLRFTKETGGWKGYYVPSDQLSFEQVDLSHLESAAALKAAIEEHAAATQATPDIINGPMMRTVYYDCGKNEPARLLIVIQHLTVDGVSWRILMDDLQRGYEQLSRGEAIELGPKTTSFQRWATELKKHAQTAVRRSEIPYWTDQAWKEARLLPLDREANNLKLDSARAVRVSLSVAETRALLQDVPETYHTQINEVLMTALGRAIGAWIGEGHIIVDLEGHGREEVVGGLDLSRTVGWFTAIFPLLLEVGETEELGTALKRVKEQLRRIPQHGIGFGMLKYLSEDEAVREPMRVIQPGQVNFNYLGQFDQVAEDNAVIKGAKESAGPAQSLENPLPTLITVNSTVQGKSLEMIWTYSETVHRRETIEWVAEKYLASLREIIAHCQAAETGEFTMSDFPLSGLDQGQFDRLSTLISELDN